MPEKQAFGEIRQALETAQIGGGMRARWDWNEANKMVVTETRKRSRKAAGVIAERARKDCPVGTVSRPMYRSGPYANQPWTARDAGQLKKSIRVVERNDEKYGYSLAQFSSIGQYGNVRVYAGNYLAYYGAIVEYSKPFLRPAVAKARTQVKGILENG